MEIWIYIFILVGMFVFAVPVMLATQVRMMSKPEKMLHRDDILVEKIESKIGEQVLGWIEASGYDFMAAYQFGQMPMAVWRKRGAVTDLLIYAAPNKVVYEFGTYLQNGGLLSTSLNGEVGMFPQTPGNYNESVTDRTLGELNAAHQNSLSILASTRGVVMHDIAADFETYMLSSTRKQMAYVKSLPFWQLRGIYWFFVKRKKMRNKTIADQIALGWV